MSKDYKLKQCLYCDKDTRNRIYCSKPCSNSNKFFKLLFNSIITEELPHHPITAKNHLKLLFGERCSICKIEEWMGQVVLLILDHKDGNSSNWTLQNLRLICSNCDAQLPTYKFKNKGNGRFKRMQRYQQGLSS